MCIVGLCSTFSWLDVAASPVPAASGVEARVVQLTNSERGNRGLARLRTPLPQRLVALLPGVDVRIVADRAVRARDAA